MKNWMSAVAIAALLAAAATVHAQDESRLERTVKALTEKIEKLEKKVEDLTKKVERLEEKIAPLKELKDTGRRTWKRLEEDLGKWMERFQDQVPDEFRALPDMFRGMDFQDLMEMMRGFLDEKFEDFDFEKFLEPLEKEFRRKRNPDNEVYWI